MSNSSSISTGFINIQPRGKYVGQVNDDSEMILVVTKGTVTVNYSEAGEFRLQRLRAESDAGGKRARVLY